MRVPVHVCKIHKQFHRKKLATSFQLNDFKEKKKKTRKRENESKMKLKSKLKLWIRFYINTWRYNLFAYSSWAINIWDHLFDKIVLLGKVIQGPSHFVLPHITQQTHKNLSWYFPFRNFPIPSQFVSGGGGGQWENFNASMCVYVYVSYNKLTNS